jgi:hypothetical protein
MDSKEKMKRMRALLQIEGFNFEDCGRVGEILIARWLDESKGISTLPIPQSPATLREYVSAGGKRPDYLVDLGDDGAEQWECLDAKMRTIADGKFIISKAELEKYNVFKEEYGFAGVIFAIVPRHAPDQVFCIVDSMLIEEAEIAGESALSADLNTSSVLRETIPHQWVEEAIAEVRGKVRAN